MCNKFICLLLIISAFGFSQSDKLSKQTSCPKYVSSSYINPTCNGYEDGKIVFNINGLADGIYDNNFYYNQNDKFDAVEVKDGVASILNLGEGVYKNIRFRPDNGCEQIGGVDVALTVPYFYKPATTSQPVKLVFCHLDQPTVSDLPKKGAKTEWTLEEVDGKVLASDHLLENNTTYYAKENYENSCNYYFYKEVVVSFSCSLSIADDLVQNADGVNGDENVLNVLENDSLEGTSVDLSNSVITTLVEDPTNSISLNVDGSVSLAPNTPAGVYTLQYSVCDQVDVTNCDTAVVSIQVADANNCPFSTKIETINPTCIKNNGKIIIDVYGIEDGVYNDNFYYNDSSLFENVTVSNGKATISNLAVGTYKNVRFVSQLAVCSEIINADVTLYLDYKTDVPELIEMDKIEYTTCILNANQTLSAWNYIYENYKNVEVDWYLDKTKYSPVNQPILNEVGTVTYYAYIKYTDDLCANPLLVPIELSIVPALAKPEVVWSCDSGLTVVSPVGIGFEYALDNGGYQASPKYADLPSGHYTLRVRNANGCKSQILISPKDYDNCLGTADYEFNDYLVLYPNPVKDVLNITPKDDTSSVEQVSVFDIYGRLVADKYNADSIDLSILPTGIYVLKVSIDGEVVSSKFFKE